MNTKCSKEQFIKKSKSQYGDDFFDYSLVDYLNGYTDIVLICKKHGKFMIAPNKHLDIIGGCPECSKERRKKKRMLTNDEYKELIIKKHGDKYDLSNTEYKGMKNKVTAVCPIHGEFSIVAYDFANNRGCPKCGRANKNKVLNKTSINSRNLTTEEFIKRAKNVHNDKYDYSMTNLEQKDDRKRVSIICPKHGEFKQSIYSHLNGCGCPKCGKENMAEKQTMTTDLFIKKAREIHGDKYDYSKVKYDGCYDYVTITCPEHGDFKQQSYIHLQGHGCPKCAISASSKALVSNTSAFISKSKQIHGDKNDYHLVEYKGAKIPVTIICEKGHIYSQMPNKHLSGHGCPYCINNISQQETEISDFIKSLGLEVVTNSRRILSESKELDIYIPSKKIAIEYDGLYWHNETKKTDKRYHLNKSLECEKQGIRLIHIFEDEWLEHKEIVKSRIKSILGLVEKKIHARKCKIDNVNNKDCKIFLKENHIQGYANSSVCYGLYYNDELVSVMSFCKLRKNLGKESIPNKYELLRFCSKLNTIVIGGASKLFNHFLKEHKPQSVISYSDRRWNTGNVYEKLGFILSHYSQPNYFYIIGQKRENRFKYRKNILVEQGFDKNKSEHKIMMERGIYRIYDCGTMVYEWKNK